MRGIWTIGALGALGLCAACIPAGQFACEQDTQCSRMAGGVCQPDGFCSYPDESCESGQRYSGFAGPVASTCVSLDSSGSSGSSGVSGSSSASDSSGASDSGPIPDSCDGVDCSGAGTCVMVDDAPTCACDPGLYPVGLQCLEDPCDTQRCYFVDDEQGDDAADGSRATPWRTIDRLTEAVGDALPGDHFLLRRGRQWTGDSRLTLPPTTGSADDPVVIGAYGPVSDPPPLLVDAQASITRSEHVVLRDLRFEVSQGPCITVEDSQYVVVQGNAVDQCMIRGIRVDEDSAYTVIIDNVITNVGNHSGIFVADTTWDDAEVGSHHWIVDNLIVATPAYGVDVNDSSPSGDPMEFQPVRSTTDVKIVGNTIVDAGDWGIRANIEGWSWVVGNTVVRSTGDTGGGISLTGHGTLQGNVVVHAREGVRISGRGQATLNTIVQQDSGRALEVTGGAADRIITDNLVLAQGGALWVELLGDLAELPDDIASMDLNWYATDGEACLLRVEGMDLDLVAYTAATGFDAASTCAPVPGVGTIPAGVSPEDFDAMLRPALTPDPAWSRCDAPAGALDCQGQPLGKRIDPIAEFDDNGGLGWSGPLIVRQRYDTSP